MKVVFWFFVVAWWHGPLLVYLLVFSPLELLENGTNQDEVHIPEVPLTPYDDEEDAGIISTSENKCSLHYLFKNNITWWNQSITLFGH